jgi:hypothetical protein
MSITETGHIVLDDRGIPWIDGTNVKVIEVVLDKLAHGSSPEEMSPAVPARQRGTNLRRDDLVLRSSG